MLETQDVLEPVAMLICFAFIPRINFEALKEVIHHWNNHKPSTEDCKTLTSSMLVACFNAMKVNGER